MEKTVRGLREKGAGGTSTNRAKSAGSIACAVRERLLVSYYGLDSVEGLQQYESIR